MLAKTHAPLSAAIGATAYATYVVSHQTPKIQHFWSGGISEVTENLLGSAFAFTPAQLATMVVIITTIGGFAIFPDLDEPNSTIVKKTGVFGEVLSRTIGPLVGGHRKGTHSFLFGIPIVAIIGALAATHHITFALLTSFAFYLVSSLLFGSGRWGTITTGVLTVALFLIALNAEITPLQGALLAGGGASLHVLEDILTKGKTYALWPLNIPIRLRLFRTGEAFENYFLHPLVSVYFSVIFALFVVVPSVALVMKTVWG